MLRTCKEIGFSVQPKKVEGPTKIIEYLGIVIDSEVMELRISETRLEEITKLLYEWKNRKSCVKRQLLSLIGKLGFVSRVVRPSRTFLRRMIELSKKVKHLHHHIRLNLECQKDILWWIKYLPDWNGKSVFYDECWSSNCELDLYTDASNVGYGAYFRGHWISQSFVGKHEWMSKMGITWRELFAIVVASNTWGNQLCSKRILFHCDNEAVVHILKSGSSKDNSRMVLVRSLFYICARFNFECSAVHVPGIQNEIADALSRMDIARFRDLAVDADLYQTFPSSIDFNEMA